MDSDVQLERNHYWPWSLGLPEPHLWSQHLLRAQLPRQAPRGQIYHQDQPSLRQIRRPHRLQRLAHLLQLGP